MPLYIADYLRKTMHLNRDQHGGYLLLIMACWDRGGRLPNDPGQLAGIARATPAEWKRLAPVLLPFFEMDGAWLIQSRVIEEHAKAARLSEARREAGKQGGRPRKQIESDEKPIGFDEHKQNETHAGVRSSPSPSPSGEVSEAIASSVADATPKGEVEQAIEIWNGVASRCGLPMAKGATNKRRVSIRARLKEAGLDGWREACAAVERSKTCRGLTDIAFKADVDFVAAPGKFQRLREGFYGSDAPVSAAAPSTPAARFSGPAELRVRILALTDPEFVAAYIDPAGWDGAARALIARTNFGAEAIRKRLRTCLAEKQITVTVAGQPEGAPV